MASGGKIQTAIRQKSEDMGPVCSDRHLCAHARMVNRYAAGCKEVQVVAGFPVWLQVIGGLVLIPSLYLIFESTAENTFASTMVRVQTERQQRVISTGVYGLVRHPMYLGAVFMMFGAPLLLGVDMGIDYRWNGPDYSDWQNSR